MRKNDDQKNIFFPPTVAEIAELVGRLYRICEDVNKPGINVEREAENLSLNHIPSGPAPLWATDRDNLKQEIISLCERVRQEERGRWEQTGKRGGGVMIDYEKGVTWEVGENMVLDKSRDEILKTLCFDSQIYEVSNLEPYKRERKGKPDKVGYYVTVRKPR